MSQHDMDIANASGSAVRADLNLALGALVSNSSGATEPTTTFAYMWWADTTAGILKQRNAANSAWINVLTLSTGLPASANNAVLNAAQTFTATQTPDNGTAAVSTTSTYTFDGADQIREVTMTNAITVTFGAPTGITQYAMYKFLLKAGDTSARTYAWNAAYKFPSATAPLTSGTTTSGSYDIISFIGGAGNTLIYQGSVADVR